MRLALQAFVVQHLELMQLREAKALLELDMDMMRAGLVTPTAQPVTSSSLDATQADLQEVRHLRT